MTSCSRVVHETLSSDEIRFDEIELCAERGEQRADATLVIRTRQVGRI